MRDFIIFVMVFFVICAAQAGPNWKNIEQAREAKREAVQQAADTKVQQQSGLEKLEATCKKAESDPELSLICDEIIEAYKELLEKEN